MCLFGHETNLQRFSFLFTVKHTFRSMMNSNDAKTQILYLVPQMNITLNLLTEMILDEIGITIETQKYIL